MKQFVNHVNHVAYVSRSETVVVNAARLEEITGAKLERSERLGAGIIVYADWSAGLEILAPVPELTDGNKLLHAHLDAHGEGFLAMVYAVEDLEAAKTELEAKGFEIGPLMGSDPVDPWYNRLVVRERIAGSVMNSMIVLCQIDYQDDMIRLVDVKETASRDRSGEISSIAIQQR